MVLIRLDRYGGTLLVTGEYQTFQYRKGSKAACSRHELIALFSGCIYRGGTGKAAHIIFYMHETYRDNAGCHGSGPVAQFRA